MEAHPAFARSARGIVLNAIALEVGDAAVIHVDRDVHDEDALGALEGVDPAREVAQVRGDTVDLLQKDAPGAKGVSLEIRGNSLVHVQ